LAEINEIREALVKYVEKAQASPDGQLSDADLEDVAGGMFGVGLAAFGIVFGPILAVGGIGLIYDSIEERW
jgi:hypothetical protein